MDFAKFLFSNVTVIGFFILSFPAQAIENPQSILSAEIASQFAEIEPTEGDIADDVVIEDVTFTLVPSYPQKNQGYIQSWNAQKGEGIANVVTRWAKQERTELSWLSENQPVLNRDFSYVGKFPDALKQLVSVASNGKLNLILADNNLNPLPKVKPEIKQEVIKAEEIAKEIEIAKNQAKIEAEAKAIAEKKAQEEEQARLMLEIKLKEIEAVKNQTKIEADARLMAEKKAKEEEQARLLLEKKLNEIESAKNNKVLENNTLLPDDLPQLQPLPIQEPTEIAPNVIPEIKKNKWFAISGAPLRDVLVVWAEQAGVRLIWQIDNNFALKETVNETGTFEKAVSDALNQYNNAKLRPVGAMYYDPENNNQQVLVVKLVTE